MRSFTPLEEGDEPHQPILDVFGVEILETELVRRYKAELLVGEKPTDHNLRILCLWAANYSDEDIAARLQTQIKARGVEDQIKKVRDMVGCDSRKLLAQKLRILHNGARRKTPTPRSG